jgi:hypothetical protein
MLEERWQREWTGKPRDLELIERNDLQPLVRKNCAKLVRDTRANFPALLIETLTDVRPRQTVFIREYAIFLQSGIWWRVPSVKVRLVYDLRGAGKIHIARQDFDALYETFYPNPWKDNTLVEGLETELQRVVVR